MSGVAVAAEPLTLTFVDNVRQTEQDLKQNRNHTTINHYLASDDHGALAEASEKPEEVKIATPIKWAADKHDFFPHQHFHGPDDDFDALHDLPEQPDEHGCHARPDEVLQLPHAAGILLRAEQLCLGSDLVLLGFQLGYPRPASAHPLFCER
nr:hypothetical protein [Tanacetum cinerariifolium]